MKQYTLPELQSLARQLGLSAKIGDTFLLHGDLGAGKTTFAQAFIQARHPHATITSPTFSICLEYEDIVHYDLYRIHDPTEFNELDIQEHFHHKICLVEWPERLGHLMPDRATNIHIEPGTTTDMRMINLLLF